LIHRNDREDAVGRRDVGERARGGRCGHAFSF
jgi:hypothetical protein